MKGFKKYHKNIKDMSIGEREQVAKTHIIKRKDNKFKTPYWSDDGFMYIRKKSKRVGKIQTPKRKIKGFRAWLKEFLKRALVIVLFLCLMLNISASLIYIPKAKGWDMDIVTFESEHKLVSDEPLDIKFVPHIAHRDLVTKDDIVEYIEYIFGDKAKIAVAIAKCESHLNHEAVGDRNLNPSSYGVFQIRAFHNRPSIDDLLDAKKNIEYAYKLSNNGSSWSPWSCYTQNDVKGANSGNPYYVKHL